MPDIEEAPSNIALPPQQYLTKHFWVSTYPYFESSLFLVPPAELRTAPASDNLPAGNSFPVAAPGRFGIEIDLFDADGLRVNQVSLEVPARDPYVLELEPLLGGCKLEQGMKHAHVVVRTALGSAVYCRMNGRENGALLGEPTPVNGHKATFFPLVFEAERSNLLCIINRGDNEASIRGRLFVGRRSPEATWSVPAHASRVFQLETDFHDFIEVPENEQAQAYLRLSTKVGDLGVQLVERAPGSREHGIYHALS